MLVWFLKISGQWTVLARRVSPFDQLGIVREDSKELAKMNPTVAKRPSSATVMALLASTAIAWLHRQPSAVDADHLICAVCTLQRG
jgi:hypothetical protein